MQSVLNQLNTLPGLVGSLVFNSDGQVLARAFPAVIEDEALLAAAGVLANGVAGLETATGKIAAIDLRFGESRLVVRPITGAYLLLLCMAQANLQFLQISVNVAIPKLEKLVASQPVPAVPAAPRLPVSPPVAIQDRKEEEKPSDFKKAELKGLEKVFLKMDGWIRRDP